MKSPLKIFPVPQKINFFECNYLTLKKQLTYDSHSMYCNSIEKWGAIWLKPYFSIQEDKEEAVLLINYKKFIKSQGYKLTIKNEKIIIEYGDKQGLYYALLTLGKLCKNYLTKLPKVEIEDWPTINKRGLLIDISRGRLPKLETLYTLVDQIALLNYNELQLYTEGPILDYQTIEWAGKDKDNLMRFEEIKLLEEYCNNRCIELIANQNILGHMKGWFDLKEYKGLSEKPEDLECTTLDISNPKSLEFVKCLIDEISVFYTSSIINANLDEPNELGLGNSQEIVEVMGKENIYLAYIKVIYQYIKDLDKQLMMWADVIDKYPKILKKLPKDITLLSWGYEADFNFEKQAERLYEWGGQFYICPGTSSWLSFSGRLQNMLENVEKAISVATKYEANILLTDWGDGGHIQHPFVSLPAYIYAGCSAWNVESKNLISIEAILNEILGDYSYEVGNIILQLGNYYLYEGIKVPNQTITYCMLQVGYEYNKLYEHQDEIIIGSLMDKARQEDSIEPFKKIRDYQDKELDIFISCLEKGLLNISLEQENFILKGELLNTIHWIKLGFQMKQLMRYEYHMTLEKRKRKVTVLIELIKEIKTEYSAIWNNKNKPSGLKDILIRLDELLKIYEDYKNDLQRGVVFNKIKHFKQYSHYIRIKIKDYTKKNKEYKKLYKRYMKEGGIKNE